MKSADDGFEALRSYDGYEFVFESGFVARFEIRQLDMEGNGPRRHPYKYSFTLHDPSGKRILGLDNAHPISIRSGRHNKRSADADHWHRDEHDKGRPYKFVSPFQLLDDFMNEVERTLKRRGVSTGIGEMRETR